jgi:uncharacterized repeat protein (TIGR03803 family)
MTSRLFGMTFVVVLVLAALAQTQTFHSILRFDGRDGAWPNTGRLAVDHTTGTLYGTTYYGGSHLYYGVVFSLTTGGTETVLYNFSGGPDGGDPYGPVIRDSRGNLYGTAGSGGSNGFGAVFKMDSAGNETVLYSFGGGISDGCFPEQGLVRDKSGNLYGTTIDCGYSAGGTIFKIDTAGKETILHNFAGLGSDGAGPYYGALLMDKKGNLYGVTHYGGSGGCYDGYAYGCGVFYELSKKGTFTLLHSFAGGTSDGCGPLGTPALDGKGNFYGTAYECGANGYGTVWKVSSSGTETILHSFAGPPSDGEYPSAGVALDNKGNLYGLTYQGGAHRYYGTLYELSSGGRFRILHSFDGSDGGYPFGDEVLIGKKGTLYGAATQGGSNGSGGTVWKYVP